MDFTELIALGSGLAGTFTGFWLGVRVCGPKLQICWTERHPRELATEVHSGKTKLSTLTAHSQHLVLAELARMNNGLTRADSAEFLQITGVGNRYVGQAEPFWAHQEPDY
jgi:hypothetical protein